MADLSQPSPKNICPFCHCLFKRVGNHLKHCPQRDGKDYTIYLSQKTINNRAGTSRKKPCPQCGKLFTRLDTHLRNNVTCKGNTPPQLECQAEPGASQEGQISAHNSQVAPPLAFDLLPLFKTPNCEKDWREDDLILSKTITRAVAEAENVDDKNRILCEGIYKHFATKYGVRAKANHAITSKARTHNRPLKKLRKMRNEARRDLRKAKRDNQGELVIQELAKKFYKLIRMHSKAQKVSLRVKASLEAKKVRHECAKSLWQFAAKILDDEGASNISPAFSSQEAEAFFYNTYSGSTTSFQCPEWLPKPAFPGCGFDEDPIATHEVQQVIRHTRSSSSPNPIDQISYRVLNKCLSLLPALTDLYNACWESANVPSAWKQANPKKSLP